MWIGASIESFSSSLKTGVTIGNFDGVHLGHQKLIQHLLDLCSKNAAESVLVTFTPHPRSVLESRGHIPLSSREQRMEFFAALGVEKVLELPFTQSLAGMSAEEFTRSFLLPLGLRHLVVGYDFTLGKNRGGSAYVLRELGERYGFMVEQLAPVLLDGDIVSSTRLRRMIAQGDVRGAALLLGRHYGFSGKVVHGEGRGHTLGYPTLNMAYPEVLLPAQGVYATFVQYGSHRFKAVTNVGQRPTFGGVGVTVESFLMGGGSVDLYGQTVVLEFVERLREERQFEDADNLVAQIGLDVARADKLLNGTFFR